MHKALADVNRLRIIRVLAVAESTVADLVAEVGLSQPLVSWHVGRLRTAGLVATRRLGRETFCRIRPEAFAAFAERQARVLGLNGTPTPTPSSVAGVAPASPADERVAS